MQAASSGGGGRLGAHLVSQVGRQIRKEEARGPDCLWSPLPLLCPSLVGARGLPQAGELGPQEHGRVPRPPPPLAWIFPQFYKSH